MTFSQKPKHALKNTDFFTCPGGQRSRNELSDVADKKIAELDNSIQISNSVQAKEPKSLSVPAKPLIGKFSI